MTENNKLFNALNQLQLNTNNNDLKALEKEIFTEDNLKNIKADEGSDLYNFLNGTDIKKIINNGHQIEDGIIISFYTRFLPTAKFHVLHVPGHYKTIDEKNNEIFDSVKDGRQAGQCCGIHALEGVLIAEALTEKGKNIKEFKAKHNNQLVKTSEDDLIEQRKILFKMEILDALNNLPETVLGTVYSKKEDGTYEINGLSKLHKLYFEEFQARCAALQAVKKELGLELDKVKLDKVPEAPKVETQKQSIPTAPQQIKQEKEIKTEKPKVEIQQDEIKKEDAPKVKTEAQKPATRIVVEEPKKEEKPQIVEKQDKAVDTQKTTEEQERDTPTEPNPSMDSQSSTASSTSTNKAPRYKVLERINDTEEKDAGFETYDVNNQPIDIDDESVKLYNKFLDQVLEEFKKEGKIVNIDLIKKKVEEKLFACFSIRNEKGEIISEDDYSDKDKKDIALAKEDYKYTAEHSELIRNRFNAIEEALKEYNKRLAGANKEMREKFPRQEAITAKQ